MNRIGILALTLNLIAAGTSWADIPLPKDQKYIDPQVRFEGAEKHPEYVFHLRYLTFTGGPGGVPPRLVRIADAKPFPLHAERRLINMQVLAMKRDEFEKRVKSEP